MLNGIGVVMAYLCSLCNQTYAGCTCVSHSTTTPKIEVGTGPVESYDLDRPKRTVRRVNIVTPLTEET